MLVTEKNLSDIKKLAPRDVAKKAGRLLRAMAHRTDYPGANRFGPLSAARGRAARHHFNLDTHSRTTRAISTNTSSSLLRERLRVRKPWSAVSKA